MTLISSASISRPTCQSAVDDVPTSHEQHAGNSSFGLARHLQVPNVSHWQAQNHHIAQDIQRRIGNEENLVVDTKTGMLHPSIPEITDRMAGEDGDGKDRYSPRDHKGASGVRTHIENFAQEDGSVEEKNGDLDERQGDTVADLLHIFSLLVDKSAKDTGTIHFISALLPSVESRDCPPEPPEHVFPDPTLHLHKVEHSVEMTPGRKRLRPNTDPKP